LPAAGFSESQSGLQSLGNSAGKVGISRNPGASLNHYCSGFTREVMISTDMSTGKFSNLVFSLQ